MIEFQSFQPQVQPTDVRTVENGLILKETTMNDGYNHQKFLQENDVHQPARREPLAIMSDENQALSNVKVVSTPKSGKIKLEKMTLGGSKDPTKRHTSAPGVKYEKEFPQVDVRRAETTTASKPILRTTDSARRSMSFLNKPTRSPHRDLSRSTSFNSPKTRHSWAGESPFASQIAPSPSSYFDLGYKHDSRFDWQPESGTPRPQTSLLQIQDSFSKSGVRKKFHRDFPETNPDLRENIISGRKHDFGSFGSVNAQVLRGAIYAS